MIEKFGMRGGLARDAEVIRCGNDPHAKKLEPYAVHHDTRGEGILDAGEPLC